MMKINKRYTRNIKQNLSFYVVVSLLTMLISVIIIAAASSGLTMNATFSSILERNKVEDAQFITLLPVSDTDIENIEDEFNVSMEYMRYYDKDEEGYTIRILGSASEMNLYEVTEGNDISSEHDMLISEQFAQKHDISIGDKVEFAEDEFTITGYMYRADYLYLVKETSDAYTNYDAFGIAVVDDSVLEDFSETKGYYSVIFYENNSMDFRKYMSDEYGVLSYTTADNNYRISSAANQGDQLLMIAMGVAPVLFIVVMLLVSLVLSRKLKSEQKQIGTLVALGYTKKNISMHYAFYCLIPGILGGVLGIIGGYFATIPFSDYYFSFFEIIPHEVTVNVMIAIIVLVVPAVLYIIVSFGAVKKIFNKKPVDMLRNTDSGNNNNSSNLAFASAGMSFRTKYRLRSVLRHKSRTAVVIVGIAVSTLCVLIGWAIRDAVDNLISTSIDKMPYTYAYFLSDSDTEIPDEAEGILVNQYETNVSTAVFQLWGYEKNSSYIDLETIDDKKMEYGKNYMTYAIAEAYGIEPGDQFTFYDIITTEEYTLTIDGIIDDNTSSVVYTDVETAAEIMDCDKETRNAIISNRVLEGEIDENSIMSSVSKSDAKESIESVVDMYYMVCYAVTVLGFLLGVLVMYLISGMIVEENEVNISMLKVLGYTRKEISNLVLNVNSLLIPVGFILGIPLTLLTCKIGFAKSVEAIGMHFPMAIKPISYVITLIVVALSYILSVFLARKKVEKVELVESLKRNNE